MQTAVIVLGILFNLAAFGCTIWLAVVAARIAWYWCVAVLLGCGIGTLIFVVKYWDEAKRPFLAMLLCAVLSGICWGGAAAMEVRSAIQTTAEGESTLPAFGEELNRAGRNETAGGAAAEGSSNQGGRTPGRVGGSEPVELPFTPTARPKPFPYKDAPSTASASVRPAAEQVAEEESADPKPAAAAAAPVLAPAKPKIEVVSAVLKRDGGDGSMEIEISNGASQAVVEVKMVVTYLDAGGRRVGNWTTTRRERPHIAPANGKGKLTELAMRMPAAARKVEVTLISAGLADATLVEY